MMGLWLSVSHKPWDTRNLAEQSSLRTRMVSRRMKPASYETDGVSYWVVCDTAASERAATALNLLAQLSWSHSVSGDVASALRKSMAELPSGTVTFLFTDIEGSTARWEHQPDAMRVALARHDAVVRDAIVEHGGHVVKSTGDGFHAVFSRATNAVAAAIDVQRRLQAEPWGEIGPIRVRMELHTGASEDRDGNYYGPALNRATRLMRGEQGGQSCPPRSRPASASTEGPEPDGGLRFEG